MKLVYRCSNCAAQNEAPVPTAISDQYSAGDMLAGNVPKFVLSFWIRHPCTPTVHGIAPLIAVIDE